MVPLELTQIHLLLLVSQTNDEITRLKPDIGAWGRKSEDWIFARQLGILAFRLENHLRHACGSIFNACLAYERARSILKEIPELWTVYFQLECVIASLSLTRNDVSGSKIYLDIADIVFTRLALELDETAEKEPVWRDAKHFFDNDATESPDMEVWSTVYSRGNVEVLSQGAADTGGRYTRRRRSSGTRVCRIYKTNSQTSVV